MAEISLVTEFAGVKNVIHFSYLILIIMLRNLLAVSAATPMIIFSYLFIKLRIGQLTVLHVASNIILAPCLTLEKVIETHFTRKAEIIVKLRSRKNELSGYIRVERDGTYHLFSKTHQEILILKKGRSGWAIIKLENSIKQPEQYVTSMIVYLESMFFS